MRFTVNDRNGTHDLTVGITQAVIAGWTGRDAAALEKHIRELEHLGVARPSSTPIFYRVSAARLTTAPVIQVSGDHSSGEVEFILVQSGARLYVGAGSDHTDRRVEAYSVSVSKQMCEKPVAPELWDFADVEDHWDALVLRSWAVDGDRRALYQEGTVSTMRTPADLIERFAAGGGPRPGSGQGLADGTVMFCGTFAAQGGIRPAQRFEFEIEDPVLKRRIRHGYDVVSLPVVA
jgi:hypothetical protein